MLTRKEQIELSVVLRGLLLERKEEMLKRIQLFETRIQFSDGKEKIMKYTEFIADSENEIAIIEKALQTNLYIE
jgi:hypothetical protein